MFGKCSECLQPCDSPGRPARQASSARHVRQPGHHWHWQPERSQARPEAPKDSPKPPGRGRPSTSKEKASVDKLLRHTRPGPGTRRLTARLSAHGAHQGRPANCYRRVISVPTGYRRGPSVDTVCGQVVFPRSHYVAPHPPLPLPASPPPATYRSVQALRPTTRAPPPPCKSLETSWALGSCVWVPTLPDF